MMTYNHYMFGTHVYILYIVTYLRLIHAFDVIKPVFITGATSKVGQRVVEKIAMRGLRTRCLVRDHSKDYGMFQGLYGVEMVQGDILDTDTLNHIMKGCSMSVNLHGVLRKSNPLKKSYSHLPENDRDHPYYVNYVGMQNIIDSCNENDIPRLIRLTGLATGLPSWHPVPLFFDSFYSDNIYWHRRGESEIMSSDLNYTILRPGGIKDKEFKTVTLKEEMTSPPGLIGVDNLAKVVVQRLVNLTLNNFELS